jgi:hypothetical protein
MTTTTKEANTESPWRDPIVAEVRRVKEEIAAEFNFDPWALAQSYKKQQEDDAASGVVIVNREVETRKKLTERSKG